MKIERPAAPLAELTVTDDVDGRGDLQPHDLVDAVRETDLIARLVVRLALRHGPVEVEQRRQSREAPDMGRENAIVIARHPRTFLRSIALLRASKQNPDRSNG